MTHSNKDCLSVRRSAFWVRCSLAVIVLIAVLLTFLVVDTASVEGWILRFGYYTVLVPLVLSACYFFGGESSFKYTQIRNIFRSDHLIAWLAVLSGAWLLLVQADFGYKIAMDEYILSSTSRNLHESREVMVTTRVAQYGDQMYPSETYVDKRPWLYPVLVSVTHDLFGYRVDNAFYLNGILGVLFLWCAYRFGCEIADKPGGALAVFIWVSLPLLAQNTSGGGMELLNLFLIQLLILLSIRYLKHPSERLEGLLSCVGVLLAYARYESLIFLFPLLIVLCLGWVRARCIFLSWASVFASLGLLPLLLQLKRYTINPEAWELTGNATKAYDWSYLVDNFPHALNFFFSFDGTLANSLLISFLGLLGLSLLLVSAPREWKGWMRDQPAIWTMLIFAPFFILQFMSVVGFHAGELDRPFVSRYALPFHWLLVGSVLLMIKEANARWSAAWKYLLGATVIYLIGFTLPTNAKSIFTVRNYAVAEQNWLEALSGTSLLNDSLIIDAYTINWSLRDWVALTPEHALSNAKLIQEQVETGKYVKAYYVERLAYENGSYIPVSPVGDRIAKVFRSKLVLERSFRPFTMMRIYELQFMSASDFNAHLSH